MTAPTLLPALRSLFGSRLQENVTLANYTTARVGGPADALLVVNSAAELAEAALRLWEHDLPFHILGSGSNVLISDAGVRGLVILNHAHSVRVDAASNPPTVWAESGANFSGVARQVALRGLSGLEWAAAIPGTVGGAVYGNAGAFGSDVQHDLVLAEILHRKDGKQTWTVEQLDYAYRTSALKRQPGQAIILAARFHLTPSTPEAVQAQMKSLTDRRRQTQPPGASLGSMFKNPQGDYAGRLIETAGLKGTRMGGVEVSTVHANFFVNHAGATAAEIAQLLRHVQQSVLKQSGILLEPEIELLGEWEQAS